ncbi:NAD-P-binding protein [Halteromyces radiatus]|uniref:NAD-P-binding protein n=1 Tax=Halteromyces radiatus TaxID=101107 RepID=UPI0022200AFF|nr:NAD-P-binding protein [Halteromyces radiatus]KAI8093445.1 NAD-P-binding protein [Halteromyces radiatus]
MSSVVDTTQIFKENLFAGKVLLCSGGGSGICRGMTEAMVRHGAKAVIISRSKDKLEKAAAEMRQATGGEIIAVAADVRKPEAVENAVQKTIEAFGRIDFLINGAAGNFLAPFQDLSYNAFRTVIEIDLLGTFNLTKAASEHLKKAKGSIINVSATLYYTGLPYQQHAGSAKAAIDALTKHWAVELGPHGVRVNGISPGPIGSTVGMKKLSGAFRRDENGGHSSIPLGRQGETMDIAQATVFLNSQGASWITGVTLVVDGGCWMTTAPVNYPQMVLNPPKLARL